ncbi:DUF421 domain-containing protein [Caenimonas soli]|uniref:DUF421 domain-containing protein n=1 Tax=Caenimonas soli TaxID=2735555 RepID=UPI001553C7E6|nr:YetF domain-containing protein [Caenimonas soli]NPC55148.1 DUF421 domain-containing protein [Caenimonas soli]
MFDMGHPWWEFVLRTAAVYVCLMVMVRFSGKRTIGQFTPFDLIVVMLLSETVSASLTGGDESLLGGLIAAATLITLNMGAAWLSAHSRRVDEALEGKPTLIGRDGVIYKDVLKGQRVPEADVEEAMREADCDLKDMRCAFLEADGKISILKRQG